MNHSGSPHLQKKKIHVGKDMVFKVRSEKVLKSLKEFQQKLCLVTEACGETCFAGHQVNCSLIAFSFCSLCLLKVQVKV